MQCVVYLWAAKSGSLWGAPGLTHVDALLSHAMGMRLPQDNAGRSPSSKSLHYVSDCHCPLYSSESEETGELQKGAAERVTKAPLHLPMFLCTILWSTGKFLSLLLLKQGNRAMLREAKTIQKLKEHLSQYLGLSKIKTDFQASAFSFFFLWFFFLAFFKMLSLDNLDKEPG